MKKQIVIGLLTLTLCISLVGCGDRDDTSTPADIEPTALSNEEIIFKNIKFENPSAFEYSETDHSINMNVGKQNSKLLIFCDESLVDEKLASTSITLQNKAVKDSFSNIANEQPFTETVAGFDAKGSSFAASFNDATCVVFLMSFWDGEYTYTISFTAEFGSDEFDSDTDSFLKIVNSAAYTK